MTSVERYVDNAPPEITERQLAMIERQAVVLAKSNLVGPDLRGKPADITTIGLMGHALQVPLQASLTQIFPIKGRAVLSAQLKLALAQRAGHEVWFPESDAKHATICGQRRGSSRVHTVTVQHEDYKHLHSKQVWQEYPAAMLRARAVTALFAMAFTDVLLGMPVEVDPYDHIDADPDEAYTPDEIVDHTDRPTAHVEQTPVDARHAGAPAGVVDPDAGGGGKHRPCPPAASDDPGGGEPVDAPQPSSEAPPAGDTDPPVSKEWVQRFAIGCREHLLSDDERHALVAKATDGRTSSSREVRESEARNVANWFVRVAGPTPTHGFAVQLDGSTVVVPLERAEP